MDTVEKIEKFRNLYGLTHDDIADRLELKKNQVKKIESGEIPEWYSLAINGMAAKLENERKKNVQSMKGKFTFIDLFAGIGGIRIAFEKAGGVCLFSSEWDKYPAKMYEDNFGEKPAGDITKISVDDIPSHDVLVGGFPCQPFSIAGVSKKGSMGRKHGFEDETQGTLFFDVARIIKKHKPKMFLLENVKNLKSHDKGNTFRVIKRTLEELGYNVQENIIDGGLLVPQHRERIYIVGTLDHSEPFVFPKIKEKETTLNNILTPESEGVDSKYTLSDKLWLALQRHAEKHKAKGNGFGYGLKMRHEKARTLSARYYKDGGEILIDQGARNPRRLTPRECARLMGFPEKFRITLSDTRAYKCFGNSVVVPILEKLAKQMAKHQILRVEEKIKQ